MGAGLAEVLATLPAEAASAVLVEAHLLQRSAILAMLAQTT